MSLRLASSKGTHICKSCRLLLNGAKRRRYGTSSLASNPDEIFDVVTVGGGPVGLALLTALSMYHPRSRHICLGTDLGRILPRHVTPEVCFDRDTVLVETEVVGAPTRSVLQPSEQHHAHQSVVSRVDRSMAPSEPRPRPAI